MSKFFKNLFWFFLSPLILISVFVYIFIERDPYMDFKTYKNYSWTYNFQSLGDLSTKKLLQSHTRYNSFVFGSSRAGATYACYLQSKIPNSQFFHYANFRETIGGIYQRMRLLDSLGYHLDNVLVWLETDNSFSNAGRPKINDHYLINGESKGMYYYNQFRFIFSDLNAFKILLGYHVEGEPNWTSDPITNDGHICSEKTIKSFGDTAMAPKERAMFIASKKNGGVFYKRPATQQYLKDQILPYDKLVMERMKALFDKYHTNYYMIIAPVYDQLKFSPNDMQILRNIFGNRVYDFSGKNAMTQLDSNYPDGVHFRHYIAKEVIDSVLNLTKRH